MELSTQPEPAAAGQARAALWALVDDLRQRPEFAALAAAANKGKGGAIDGVWGSAVSPVAAALAHNHTGPLLVVSPHLDDLDDLADELTLFSGREVLIFPGWDVPPEEPDPLESIAAQRLRVIKRLMQPPTQGEAPPLIVGSIHALMQPMPAAEAIAASTRQLRVGDEMNVEELLGWLVEHGLRNMPAVELPGEFAQRGGILDLYCPDWDEPVRVELFGDEIESIRRFDVATQRSLTPLESIDLTILPADLPRQTHPAELLCDDCWVALIEPMELEEQGRRWLGKLARRRGLFTTDNTLKRLLQRPTFTIAQLPQAAFETTCQVTTESVERFQGAAVRLEELLAERSTHEPVFLVCGTDVEAQRLSGELAELIEQHPGRVHLPIGRLRAGFHLVQPPGLVLSGSELLGRRQAPQPRSRRQMGRSIDSFLELREGDYVVHVSHGIGRYCGLRMLEKDRHREEYLELEFHGGTRIYVPTSKIDLVQKYVGGGAKPPTLSRIGGRMWTRRKEQAEEAVTDMASDMLGLQAQRQALQGIQFDSDSLWQQQFEQNFPYNETPDQLTALVAIKEDMQQKRPMDRLICGEVGFGKTEVAMRAAFKAVDNGYQVAVLVPTTILAEQHYRTFRERMEGFPFTVGCLSRFRSKSEQQQLLDGIATGGVDILIGTHRLLQPDVHFRNLGLLVVDEEQRFGVEAKEKLKMLRTLVDVITLTATPIPRTLHLSLLGVRDISNLETPPANRLAVETRVTRWDDTLLQYAIERELGRGGQVFFVHNRIHDLEKVAKKIHNIVPDARLRVAHGRMGEDELSRVMMDFVDHKSDVLLATTIIESGLDIQRANTMFINQADKYGLAELHQLRGRVGRYKHRAYCYLLVDPHRTLTGDAAKRLKAIEEFSSIGAGFGIAMRDLEIRGAGNLLGTEQSGHIAAVGYEMYCQLLDKAVRRLKDEPPEDKVEVTLSLPGEAAIPRSYVPDMRMKIDLYRRLSRVTRLEHVDEIETELFDRFGRLPEVVSRLLRQTRLRILAHRWGVQGISREEQFAVLRYRDRNLMAQLVLASRGRLRIVDPRSAYYPLKGQDLSADQIYAQLESLLQREPQSG